MQFNSKKVYSHFGNGWNFASLAAFDGGGDPGNEDDETVENDEGTFGSSESEDAGAESDGFAAAVDPARTKVDPARTRSGTDPRKT